MRSRPSPSCCTYFYPRPPRGGRHSSALLDKLHHLISIHALREEGDKNKLTPEECKEQFLSTPSARRATL